jgi:hypothetical protein
MGLGGPVWHASAQAGQEAIAWAMAARALRGVGDPQLGEWSERGRDGVMHVRRRLTDRERRLARRPLGVDLLQVRDIRGTDEERQRLRRLLKDAPELRPILEAML